MFEGLAAAMDLVAAWWPAVSQFGGLAGGAAGVWSWLHQRRRERARTMPFARATGSPIGDPPTAWTLRVEIRNRADDFLVLHALELVSPPGWAVALAVSHGRALSSAAFAPSLLLGDRLLHPRGTADKAAGIMESHIVTGTMTAPNAGRGACSNASIRSLIGAMSAWIAVQKRSSRASHAAANRDSCNSDSPAGLKVRLSFSIQALSSRPMRAQVQIAVAPPARTPASPP